MALFVLREGFHVETTETGGRVVHESTGYTLELSPPEVQLLARATAGGVDGNERGYRPLVKKLSMLGLLVEAPATASDDEPGFELTVEPESTPRGDASVPLFRSDLKLERTSPSLFSVTAPDSNKTFTLYDFELSLARMLDGQRTLNSVVEAGQRLGIPVNLESLGQFIRQLERYGFLAPPGSAPDSQNPWPPREKWDEGLRALFQSGLKMSRQGRYAEAIGYYEAMLHQDPDNPEALEMLAQAQQRLSGNEAAVPVPEISVDPLDKPLSELLFDAEPDLPMPPSGSNAPDPAPAPIASAPEPAPQAGIADVVLDAVNEPAVQVDGEGLDVSFDDTAEPLGGSAGSGASTSAEASGAVASPVSFDVEPKALLASEQARGAVNPEPATPAGIESLFDDDSPESAEASVEIAVEEEPGPAQGSASSSEPDAEASFFREEASAEVSGARASGGSRLLLALTVVIVAAAAGGGGWYLGYQAGRDSVRSESPAEPVASHLPEVARPNEEVAGETKASSVDARAEGKAPTALGAANTSADGGAEGRKEVAAIDTATPDHDAGAGQAAVDEVENPGSEPGAGDSTADEAVAVADAPDEEPSGVAAAGETDDGRPPGQGAEERKTPDAAENRAAEHDWRDFAVDRRGRVTMCSIEAPAKGGVNWKVAPRKRIRRKQAVGAVGKAPLSTPCSGLLIPKIDEAVEAAKGAKVADVVYHEGFLQTVVQGAKPEPGWRCEVVDEATSKRAECKVVKAAPRTGGFFLTATFEPMWFDEAAKPKLRLAPPEG